MWKGLLFIVLPVVSHVRRPMNVFKVIFHAAGYNVLVVALKTHLFHMFHQLLSLLSV